ncbi:MAG TPA: helix-hairpin-helix domain-containing protein [Chloroflexota bacterium]|nr:helix-hairpin-helix domain-containing protein [Chloroflexota bacterium]
MKTITVTSAVPYRNNIAKAGDTIEVTEAVYEDFASRGLIHKGKGPTEQSRLRRTMSEYAAREGDEDGDEIGAPAETRFVFLPVTAAQYDALSAAGYGSPDAVAAASDEELLAIQGINAATVKAIRGANGASGVDR